MGACTYQFADLKTLLARATPLRAGDGLAGVAATTSDMALVLAEQARVALGDEVGQRLRARLVLIGERPGLSTYLAASQFPAPVLCV